MKKKTTERTAFNFYKSYFTSLELLDDKEKLEFLMALFHRQFYGVEPSLSKLPQMVYNTQRHSIDKQVDGFESKTNVKLRPPQDPSVGSSQGSSKGSSKGGYEDPMEQEQGQEQVEEKEQVKELVEELDMFSPLAQKLAERYLK